MRPLHDWASNGADAFRQFGTGYRKRFDVPREQLMPEWSEDF
jgi:hypothetical protein